ncbi:hypothetical protein ACSD1J_001208 [Escherichia coli]
MKRNDKIHHYRGLN